MYIIVNEEGESFEESFLTEEEAIDAAAKYFDDLIESDADFENAEWFASREGGTITVRLIDEDGIVEELEIVKI